MLANQQIELVKSLQQSEVKRFLKLDTIYETVTRNPIGLRFSNLQRALNILAATKFVGWNDAAIDVMGFQQLACELVEDIFFGAYISELPPAYANEFKNPSESQSWFDLVKASLYVAYSSGCIETADKVAKWVQPQMTYDCGMDDVPELTNATYCFACNPESFTTVSGTRGKPTSAASGSTHATSLWKMAVAIGNDDEEGFVEELNRHMKNWRPARSGADMYEIVAIDASNICNLALHRRRWSRVNESNNPFLHKLTG